PPAPIRRGGPAPCAWPARTGARSSHARSPGQGTWGGHSRKTRPGGRDGGKIGERPAAASDRGRSPRSRGMGMHDLVIRGGTVVDGTGAAAITADVAVEGGVITEVGSVEG